jgi:hypothetical protein
MSTTTTGATLLDDIERRIDRRERRAAGFAFGKKDIEAAVSDEVKPLFPIETPAEAADELPQRAEK